MKRILQSSDTAVSRSSGNVLFLILIAVALFAALSYVVTSSTRSGSGSVSTEEAKMKAAELMQYATAIEVGVGRVKIRGVSDSGMDFFAPREPTNANANCTTPKCRIFDPQGGGVIWRNVQGTALGQSYYSASVKNVGTTAPDLILFMGNTPKDVCQYINYKMGVSPSVTSPVPADSHSGAVRYAGTLTAFPSSSKIFGNTTNPQFAGKHDFCYSHGSWGTVYIHVLIAR